MPQFPNTDFLGIYNHTWRNLGLYLPSFGARAGVASDGVLAGSFPTTAMGSVQVALTGGTAFTDYTTAANNATTNDVNYNLAALNDAIYFGHATQPFSALKVKYSTAGVYTATTVWEYWNGAWTAIPAGSFLLDSTASSGAFKAAAGTYFVTFAPPTDWVKTTVNSVSGYYIRNRISAFTSVTTAPKLDQTWVYTTNSGTGFTVGVNGQLKSIDFAVSSTLSASNNDTKLMIMDGTTGAYYIFTATKATAQVTDSNPTLPGINAGDQVLIQQLQGDGTTEFAGVNLNLIIQPLS